MRALIPSYLRQKGEKKKKKKKKKNRKRKKKRTEEQFQTISTPLLFMKRIGKYKYTLSLVNHLNAQKILRSFPVHGKTGPLKCLFQVISYVT